MGQTWTGLSLVIGIVAAFSALGQAWLAAQAFAITAGLLGFAGGLIWSATGGVKIIARAAEASAYVMAMWVTTPLFLVVPFLFFIPDASYLDGAFEAYSALTTTGAILSPPEAVPDAIIFWRCFISFVGGYLTLLTAAGVLAAFDRGGLELRKSILLTVDQENIFSNLQVAARRILVVYCGILAVGMLALIATGVPIFEALCLAMSALSTGGYTVSSGPLLSQVPALAIALLAVLAFAGAINIAVVRDAVSRYRIPLNGDLLAMLGVIAGLYLIFLISTDAPAAPLSSLADAIFVITTAGFSATESAGYVPLAAVLAAMIGGAAASTAGGLKISRLVILSQSAFVELARMANPSGVVGIRYRGRSADNPAMLALWATVLSYIGLVAISIVILSLLGAPFDAAWSVATTALANAGPLHNQLSPEFSWSDLPAMAKIYSILLMVLGRLEVLAGLAAIVALFRRF